MTMTDKFTVRDLLVYFMTGLFLFLILLNQVGHEKLLEFFNIDETMIKRNSFWAGILLISALYILGHLVCAIRDVISREIGERLRILRPIYYVINGNRVSGIFRKGTYNGITIKQFWKRVHELRHYGRSDSADYWNLEFYG